MSDSSRHFKKIDFGDTLYTTDLQAIPAFKTISASLLEKNAGAAVRRNFKKGEIICREGEQGTTAFYILEGKVDVFISASVSRVRTEPEKKSWFKKMKSLLVKSKQTAD